MSAPAAPPMLLTIEELARELCVSRRTVEGMLAAGRTPAPVRIARCVRFRRDDIERWIAWGAPNRQVFEARAAIGRPRSRAAQA